MIRSPFPSFVAFATATRADLETFELFPEEAAALSLTALESRVLEFRLGRAAARLALGTLQLDPQPIVPAADGRPLWPEGVVGAITHTKELAAVAIAHTRDTTGIGLDLEPRSRQVSPDAAAMIASGQELEWTRQHDVNERILMIFAAKEAIFKALYPLDQIFLNFADAELTWHEDARAFSAVIGKRASLAHPAGFVLTVDCQLTAGFVLASTHLP